MSTSRARKRRRRRKKPNGKRVESSKPVISSWPRFEKVCSTLLLCGGAVRDVHEIGERALNETRRCRRRFFFSSLVEADGPRASTRTENEGKKALSVADGDDDRRWLARVDVIGKTRRHDQVAKRLRARRPRDEERRSQQREDQKEKIVARVPCGEGDDAEDADEDDAALRQSEAASRSGRLLREPNAPAAAQRE